MKRTADLSEAASIEAPDCVWSFTAGSFSPAWSGPPFFAAFDAVAFSKPESPPAEGAAAAAGVFFLDEVGAADSSADRFFEALAGALVTDAAVEEGAIAAGAVVGPRAAMREEARRDAEFSADEEAAMLRKLRRWYCSPRKERRDAEISKCSLSSFASVTPSDYWQKNVRIPQCWQAACIRLVRRARN